MVDKSKEKYLVRKQDMQKEWQFECTFSAKDCSCFPIKCSHMFGRYVVAS